ncbi:MAG: tRNA preQ1(34) S-adenosylmethionine ribosyltransferase-isomerase QueA [Phycisphaerae bacterium]
MRTAELDYELPKELIAQRPLSQRDASRLLVLRRVPPGVAHERFRDLPRHLRAGDCLVINQTRVVPARFVALRRTGGRVEGLVLGTDRSGRWEVLLDSGGRLRPGEWLELRDGPGRIGLEKSLGRGRWLARLDAELPGEELLERIGRTPLPPYIKRADDSWESLDRQRYQTVYASEPGAVAAPTAGLHFTRQMLDGLAALGVQIARLTLHVGLGTFEPIRVERLADHRMRAERYVLPVEAAETINRVRQAGGRVVCVGTTVVRVLETCARGDGTVRPGRGETSLFIYPPYRFRVVDALLTNFHLPGSTLLALVFAFAGREKVLWAYREAIRLRYRFYSYGDAMLIV